jgi:two-component system chemotaxis response regulator CheY
LQIDVELHTDIANGVTDVQDELLSLERRQTTGQTGSASESLQLLLRRAHSLKGLLRLADLPSSANLIHQVESVLVVHIHAETKIPKNSIDLTFDALDAIAASLELPREDATRLFAIGAKLKSVATASSPTVSARRSFPFVPSPTEFARIEKARESGQQIYTVEKPLRTDIPLQLFETLPIRDDITSTGSLVAERPAHSDLDRTRPEAILTFVVATSQTAAEIDTLIFDNWSFCQWPTPPPPSTALPQAAGPKPCTQSPASTRRFLIVEDEPTSQFLLRELLHRYGTCHTAANGMDALLAINQSIDKKTPFDAVCLDIMMPGIDGHAVLREIRRVETNALIPIETKSKVIMTTALSDYEHFHRAFVEECDSYLVKPISAQALHRQLVRLGLAGPD